MAGSLLLAILINVMFFMGFPPVAQYVAKGLIIVGAMALRLLQGALTPMRSRLLGVLLHRVTLTYLLVVGCSGSSPGSCRPGFSSYGHLRYLLELAAVTGIAAAGQTLVVIAAGIDLSVASVITFAAMILPLVSRPLGPDRARGCCSRCCCSAPASASSTGSGSSSCGYTR